MKIFAVALIVFLVEGSQGAAIPLNESAHNQSIAWYQPFQDLGKIVSKLHSIVEKNLYSSPSFKSVMNIISERIRNSINFDYLVENLITEISDLLDELELEQHPLFRDDFYLLREMVISFGEGLHESLGNETFASIHNALVAIHNDIEQYTS